ncbi:hypothetical protein GGI04_000157 [Coemansia thaxteri]|nr:hypothetical protein GGI04_000157 [Coemansia thaxteri]KAJ2474384.1 hypothetical protein GGI02_000094 [Coemansia sp. RSA 2322]
MTATVVLTLALQMEWTTPFQVFYSYDYAFSKGQYWRVVTTFLYMGKFSLEWLLNMYFIIQYCRDLEEGSFLNRPADFAWMLILMCATLLVVAPSMGYVYLGSLLVSSLTYMWSRFYSYLFINFMGLLTISAAYFPWVMLAFSSIVENRWPTGELAAIGVGHVFWFLSEEWPRRAESGGRHPLRAPKALCKLLHQDLDGDADIPIEMDAGDGHITALAESAARGAQTDYGAIPSRNTESSASSSVSKAQDELSDREDFEFGTRAASGSTATRFSEKPDSAQQRVPRTGEDSEYG